MTRLLLLLCLLCPVACDVAEAETPSGTVYPLPPGGPCGVGGGDTYGQFPNCQVASGRSSFVAASFADGGLSTEIIQFPVSSAFLSPTILPGTAGTFYISFYTPGLTWQGTVSSEIFVPAPTGTLNSQDQANGYYRLYRRTPSEFESPPQSVTLYAGFDQGAGCKLLVTTIGRVVSVGVGQTANIGDSFIEYDLVAGQLPALPTTIPLAIGAGTIQLGQFSDPSQAANTVAFSYTADPSPPFGQPGNVLVTATSNAVTGSPGIVDWTLQARTECN